MDFQKITNRDALAAYFRQSPEIQFYSLGDLDDNFWPRTSCYGLVAEGKIRQAVSIYQGPGLPVLLALSGPDPLSRDVFQGLIPRLPDPFYAHLSPGLERHFQSGYEGTDYGDHLKMVLADTSRMGQVETAGAFRLQAGDLPDILELYQLASADNGFDPDLLRTGLYFGIRQAGRLISIAGVHVFSRTYGAAALGNIATHPDFRGQGWGRTVTSRVCQELIGQVEIIGLNVKSDNLPARNLYTSLGFRITSAYREFSFQKQPQTG